MTTTVFKHEWLRTRSTLGAVAGLAALFAVMGSLLALTGWPLLSTLGLLVGALATVGLVPVLQLVLTADFWRSSYTRTGYFTQSLPVNGARIYAAKLLWAMVVTLGAMGVSLLLALVLWLGAASGAGGELNPLPTLTSWWSELVDTAPVWLIVAGLLSVVAMYLIWPVFYYFAVSVGYEARWNRFGLAGPLLVFIALYVVMQVVVLVGIIAVPVGIGMQGGELAVVPFDFLDEVQIGTNTSGEVMPIGYLPTMALVAGVCVWRTARSWRSRIALV